MKLVAVLAGFAFTVLVWAQATGAKAAKQFFARYAAMENAYDSGVADLYADEAFIKRRRSMPMGEPQDVIVPAPKYRTMLRQNVELAKARGDRNSYSNVTYTPEGEFVRIDALRLSEPRKIATPISLVVGRSPDGKWLIYEELSESR